MSIVSVTMNIVGGAGGPNLNAIPIYADNKAPNGNQVIGPNGKQLMLENSADSGIQYIVVNPALLTADENQGSKFVTFKTSGEPNYIRIWIRNPETGKGDDYAPGVQMWAEYSHLDVAETEPPEPPAESESIFVINWTDHTILLKPE